MVCFVVILKEAFLGFSHIRHAEQLGLHKRIIYTGAPEGKGKLSSFCVAHMDKYKCTHEATHTVKYENNDTHTIVHLSSMALYSDRQWKDLT